MPKVELLNAVIHNGTEYKTGSTFEGDAKTVAELIEAGAARDPKAPVEEPDTSAVDEAEAKAKEIVDEAKADADKIREDAEHEAKNITGKAQEAADLKVKEADELLATAKADAEKIVKAAKGGAQTKPATPAK